MKTKTSYCSILKWWILKSDTHECDVSRMDNDSRMMPEWSDIKTLFFEYSEKNLSETLTVRGS